MSFEEAVEYAISGQIPVTPASPRQINPRLSNLRPPLTPGNVRWRLW